MEKGGELTKFLSLGRKILTLQINPLPCEHPLKSSVPFRSVLVRSVPFRSRVNGALVCKSYLQWELGDRVSFPAVDWTNNV